MKRLAPIRRVALNVYAYQTARGHLGQEAGSSPSSRPEKRGADHSTVELPSQWCNFRVEGQKRLSGFTVTKKFDSFRPLQVHFLPIFCHFFLF